MADFFTSAARQSAQTTGYQYILLYLTILVGLLLSLLTSCTFRAYRSISYPIPVYYKGESPPFGFRVLEAIELSDIHPRTSQNNYRRALLKEYAEPLPRGYHMDEKEILTYHLARKAQQIGAQALIEVEYTFFVSQDHYGYKLRGYAVQIYEHGQRQRH